MASKRPPTAEDYARQCPIPPPPPAPYKIEQDKKVEKKDDDSLWPLLWLAWMF